MFRTILLLMLAITCVTFTVRGQYRKSMQDYYYKKVINSNRFWQRLSIGGGKHFFTGKAKLEYSGWDIASNAIYSKNAVQDVRLKSNWTFYMGSYFPVTIVSDNSMIVINTELMMSIFTVTYDSLKFLGTNEYAGKYDSYKAGALFSVEYRSGGDVTLNKKESAMFTIGAGVNPCIVNSDDYNIIVPYKLIPFVKAEVGFFAGIAFKIRGIAYIGNSVYANETSAGISNTGVGDKLKTNITGTNGIDIALIAMPFSYSWNSQKW